MPVSSSIHRIISRSGGGNLSCKPRNAQISEGGSEIRVVQQVEAFPPELPPQAFSPREVLVHREVEVETPGSIRIRLGCRRIEKLGRREEFRKIPLPHLPRREGLHEGLGCSPDWCLRSSQKRKSDLSRPTCSVKLRVTCWATLTMIFSATPVLKPGFWASTR